MQSLARPCPAHPNKTICAICFHKGCKNPLICVTCAKTHPNEHEEAFNDLSTLQNNPEWVAAYERIKYHLNDQKDTVLPQYKSMITTMVDKVIQALEDKKQSLLKDLTDLVNAQDYTLFSLFDNFRIDRSISSESIDNSGDLIIPDEDDIAQSAEEAINNLRPDEIKINHFQNELTEIINDFKLNHFLSISFPKRIYRFNDYEELKNTNEKLYQNLKSQSETADNEMKNLRNSVIKLTEENKTLQKRTQYLTIIETKLKIQTEECTELKEKINNFTSERNNLEKEKSKLTNELKTLEKKCNIFTRQIRKEFEEGSSKRGNCGLKKSLWDGVHIFYCTGHSSVRGKIISDNPRCSEIYDLHSCSPSGLYLMELTDSAKQTYTYTFLG